MIERELTAHLKYVHKLLSTLMNSYEDYQSKKRQEKEQTIPLIWHFIYIVGIVAVILIATLTISFFIQVTKSVLLSITIGQIFLAIGVYAIVMRIFMKDRAKEGKSEPKAKSTMSIYELDQLRFKILQDLAKSPIPPTYLTPTAIDNMLNLVESGMCMTLEECMTTFNKEVNNQKHIKELETIKHLQMISYH